MGKKSEKKADDGETRKKKSKGKAASEPLMLRVQRCPPIGDFVFEWVVGNGIGKHAVRDALRAYKEAYPARLERAHAEAHQLPALKCGKKCADGELVLVGPVSGMQAWDIDENADPPTASTWNWVGYAVVKNCGCQ